MHQPPPPGGGPLFGSQFGSSGLQAFDVTIGISFFSHKAMSRFLIWSNTFISGDFARIASWSLICSVIYLSGCAGSVAPPVDRYALFEHSWYAMRDSSNQYKRFLRDSLAQYAAAAAPVTHTDSIYHARLLVITSNAFAADSNYDKALTYYTQAGPYLSSLDDSLRDDFRERYAVVIARSGDLSGAASFFESRITDALARGDTESALVMEACLHKLRMEMIQRGTAWRRPRQRPFVSAETFWLSVLFECAIGILLVRHYRLFASDPFQQRLE